MTHALLFLLHAATLAAIAAAMVLPAWRGRVAVLVTSVGACAAVGALATGGAAPRELELFHTFASYQGSEIRLTDFLVDRASAPGFAWGLSALGFCVLWAAWLWRGRPGDDPDRRRVGAGTHPFWGPMALVWTAIGAELALQKAAAPAGLVTPLPFDRAILLPALAACIMLALQIRKVVLVLAWLTLFVTFARLPIAIFGTLATQNDWGTSLDVHTVTLFANPLAQTPMEVAAYSPEQLGWLIWAPNLLVMPALYMLSLGGIGFAITMFVLHPKTGLEGRPRPAD